MHVKEMDFEASVEIFQCRQVDEKWAKYSKWWVQRRRSLSNKGTTLVSKEWLIMQVITGINESIHSCRMWVRIRLRKQYSFYDIVMIS